MIYYNIVVVESMDFTKAYNAMKKLTENYVNAYELRSTLKSALSNLDKNYSVNEVLRRVMKSIDRQIKTPKTDYRGKSDDDLAVICQNSENGTAWQ
jgi:phosphopantothenate synthetase